MGMVRQIYVSRREAGWFVSTPLDRVGPFLGDLDAAVFALALAYRAPPADVVLHVGVTPASACHPAQKPGRRPASPEQLRALASLLAGSLVWSDDELERTVLDRYGCRPSELTFRQAEEWIVELTPGART